MVTEATGILLGTVSISGMIFDAYYSFTEDW